MKRNHDSKAFWVLFNFAMLFTVLNSGCATLSSPGRGALIGSTAGTLIGAKIGKEVGHPITGAVIGAMSGGVVGSEIEQQNAYRGGLAQTPYGSAAAGISIEEVVALSTSGVSPDLIQNQIRSKGFFRTLNTSELMKLNQAKVDPEIIQMLQQSAAYPPSLVPGPNRGPVRPYYRRGPRRHFYYPQPCPVPYSCDGPYYDHNCNDFSVHVDL